ncbi:MAG: (E)-4-hydroxy-3-methylbut-2-enyl-diphosphate synthase [Bacteroides sp.]
MASEKVYERFQRPIASSGAWKLSVGRTLARRVRLTRNALTVQTMTTTAASDVEETLEQLVLFRKAGADIIRVTVPTLQDAKALQEVMRKFVGRGKPRVQRGYAACPVVADIHFAPQVALEAAKYVDAVRINPGNYLNRETPRNEAEEAQARQKIFQKVGELIEVCKENNVVVRIGVNHGSLAPRIIEKYGAGLEGMVYSAMEFIEVCRHFQFEQKVVVSLKASDVKQMVFANRLLVRTLQQHGFYNKLHLGVTEAGAGEDGRIKSAIGIGALLADGIGETIRVSLTEDPLNEIVFGRAIISHIKQLTPFTPKEHIPFASHFTFFTPPQIQEREVPKEVKEFRKGLVFAVHRTGSVTDSVLEDFGFVRNAEGLWQHQHSTVDVILCEEAIDLQALPRELYSHFMLKKGATSYVACDDSWTATVVPPEFETEQELATFCMQHSHQLFIIREAKVGIARPRYIANLLYRYAPTASVVFWQQTHQYLSGDALQAAMGIDYGALLLDDFGNGFVAEGANFGAAKRNAFALLQSLGLRRVHAEFVGCPGCGRTLFALQTTFEKVKAATAHLRHLKIAVMGCIVNGPGEMGDADYGYVGAGPGKITLYKSGEVAKHNIPEASALDELLRLIKESGDWREP